MTTLAGPASTTLTGRPVVSDRVRLIRLQARWALARQNPIHFLGLFTWTCDQHDKAKPIKLFPAGRPHVRHLVNLWLDNPLLALCKSRQMLQTWLFCALALWDAAFHGGRLIMLQSKREEDAIGDRTAGDGLLGRVGFILDHIPARRLLLGDAVMDRGGNRIVFPTTNSVLWAIPQGGAIIRQHTASGILSDEAAFQPEFEDAYAAARPCVRGGGWFVALSTANPGAFQLLYEDRMSA